MLGALFAKVITLVLAIIFIVWNCITGTPANTNSTTKEAMENEKRVGGEPDMALDAELAQLRMSNAVCDTILAHATRGKNTPRHLYELDNVVERWILALVNTPGAPGTTEPWAMVYRRSSNDEGFNRKLVQELVEKKLTTQQGAKLALDEVLVAVHNLLAAPPKKTGFGAHCSKVSIWYGDGYSRPAFEAKTTARLALLTEIGGCEAVLKMALRYGAMRSRGQQWAVPRGVCKRLYDEHNLRNEGFASPLNACLLGWADTHFCSAFPDTDGVFGSIGGFFSAKLSAYAGAWLVNPPFVEELLERAAAFVVAAIKDGLLATVFFVAPAWSDSAFHSVLMNSGFVAATRKLARNTYEYENTDGKCIPAKFDSLFFALAGAPTAAHNAALLLWNI
jgi:hypothetical protein